MKAPWRLLGEGGEVQRPVGGERPDGAGITCFKYGSAKHNCGSGCVAGLRGDRPRLRLAGLRIGARLALAVYLAALEFVCWCWCWCAWCVGLSQGGGESLPAHSPAACLAAREPAAGVVGRRCQLAACDTLVTAFVWHSQLSCPSG